jgi:hypothetical protein
MANEIAEDLSCTRGDRAGGRCLQLEPRGLQQGVSVAFSDNNHHIARDSNDVNRTTTPNDGGTTYHAAGGGLLRSTAV